MIRRCPKQGGHYERSLRLHPRRSDLCSALVLEDPPFFSCQGERRKSAFNYVDLSTVCHDFLNQSQETDFVLYYFSRQRIWEFFPLQARERLRPRSIAAAAKYRRKHPDRDLRVPFWPRTALAACRGMGRYAPALARRFIPTVSTRRSPTGICCGASAVRPCF